VARDRVAGFSIKRTPLQSGEIKRKIINRGHQPVRYIKSPKQGKV
jgi:hypothetical protein